MARILHGLGLFSVRHRRAVISTWLLVLLAVFGAAATLSKPFEDGFSVPGTESQEAIDLIETRTPGADADAAGGRIVFAVNEGRTLRTKNVRAAVEQAVDAIGRVPGVASIGDPYTDEGMSTDGRIAYADVDLGVAPKDVGATQTDGIASAVDTARAAGLRVELGGDIVKAPAESPIGEILGLVVAAVVLVITFGSVLAAGLPLLTAMLGVAVGVMGISAATAFTSLSDNTQTLTLMLGLAVGIDYALLILTRHRSQVRDGMEKDASIAKAIGTAGSAVVFAGTTVVIALVALSVTGIPLLTQMGLAAAATVAVAVLVSLTLVPALIAVGGRHVVRGKVMAVESSSASPAVASTLGARWIAVVAKRSVLAVALPVLALGAMALPALDLQLALPGDGAEPLNTTQRQAYELLSDGFGPGFNGPLTVAAVLPVGATGAQQAADKAAATLKDIAGVAKVFPAQINPAGDLALIRVVPATAPTDSRTGDVVRSIRDAADGIADATGTRILVTGQTAVEIDASKRMGEALVPYLAVIVGLALLLLLIAFRSVLVPVTALAGFLLTIAATSGAVVAVFQNGFAAKLIGVDQTGPLASILPVIMIGVLFGLAMDYQIFIVSRMHEEMGRGAEPQDAVRDGFRHSARVVTVAALIMTSVFSGFMIPDNPIIKSVGFSFALGVLIDAFLVRMTLIPALMLLMGHKAWWLPAWLDRVLPDLDLEGTALTRERTGTKTDAPDEAPELSAVGVGETGGPTQR